MAKLHGTIAGCFLVCVTASSCLAAGPFSKGEPFDAKAAQDYYIRSAIIGKANRTEKEGVSLGLVKPTIMRDLESVYKSNPQTHASLVKGLGSWCNSLANSKKYNHSTRYVSMLVVGGLNERESSKTNPVPVPYKGAYSPLYKAITSKTLDSDPVRVAALIGLKRHADLHRAGSRMPSKYAQAFVGALVKFVESECPPDRSLEGHDWMQRIAIETLGSLGSAGKNNAIAKVIDAAIRDEDASISKRCAAIEALARLNIKSVDNMNVEKTKLGLATTTALVCRKVSNQLVLRWQERENNGGGFEGGGGYGGGYGGGGYGGGGYGGEGGYGGGGYGGGGYGGGGYGGEGGYGGGYGGAEEEEEEPKEDPLLTEARRELKYRLGCIDKGIKRFVALAPEDAELAELGTQVAEILAEIDADEIKLNAFNTKVATLADTLEGEYDIETEAKAPEPKPKAPPAEGAAAAPGPGPPGQPPKAGAQPGPGPPNGGPGPPGPGGRPGPPPNGGGRPGPPPAKGAVPPPA